MPDRDVSWTQRAQAVALYYVYGLVQELQRKDVILWAQAIAFKVLITIVPILILGIGLLGRVLRGDSAFSAVMRVVRDFLPASQEQQVVSFLTQLQDASGAVIGLGGIGLFLSAFSLFITLRIGVRNAFAQTWHEGRGILKGYLFDIRMVGQVGLLFLATVLISFLATTQLSTETLMSWGVRAPWLLQVMRALAGGLALALPFLITTVMFFQLYYLVPLPHPRKRSALVGAAMAAGVWEVLKYAFTYYAVYVGQFDQYAVGAEGFSALGNTFGLMVAFVFWVYFSGIVFMLGAVVASLHEHRHVMARPKTASHQPVPPPE
jgi:membrane protein